MPVVTKKREDEIRICLTKARFYSKTLKINFSNTFIARNVSGYLLTNAKKGLFYDRGFNDGPMFALTPHSLLS
jgi:hypothetical protein